MDGSEGFQSAKIGSCCLLLQRLAGEIVEREGEGGEGEDRDVVVVE
jgi:hypothetical protein